jgi:hypothetical protein
MLAERRENRRNSVILDRKLEQNSQNAVYFTAWDC